MISTRILIAGQGLAGSMLALELWKNNVDFLVVDEPSPSAASAVAGGAFIPLVFRTLKKAAGIDSYLPAMFSAFGYAKQLLGVGLLHKIPSLKLFHPSALPQWQRAAGGTGGGFITDVKDRISLAGVAPGFAGAIIEPSGYVDTALLVSQTRQWLINQGRLISEKLDYTQLEITTGNVVYGGRIQAKKLVFCQGAYGMDNPWFGRAGFALNKGEILQIVAPGLCADYILRDEVFILPLGNSRFRVGATYDRQNIDTMPGEEGRQELRTKLEKIIEVPYEVTGHVAGVRPAIKDRQPIMGNHPDYPNLFIFNGLGSKGVLFAPYRAKELCRWLVSGVKSIPGEVDVKRYL